MIVTDAVSSYLESLRARPDPVLADMEAQAEVEGVPIVVPQTGALLHCLALVRGARRVVEVGTAIGVSTLYIARALPPGGVVVSFEIDPRRHQAACEYLSRAGVADRADLRLEDARSGLAGLEGPFEMAFIDGTKAQYVDYFELVLPLLGERGVLIVDNVLMDGTVADGHGTAHWTQKSVDAARALNERVLALADFYGTVTPVGDGVLVAVRR